jgi:hypothetical protein
MKFNASSVKISDSSNYSFEKLILDCFKNLVSMLLYIYSTIL